MSLRQRAHIRSCRNFLETEFQNVWRTADWTMPRDFRRWGFGLAALGFTLALGSSLPAQTLAVTYGAKGVQTISFGGLSLEDMGE